MILSIDIGTRGGLTTVSQIKIEEDGSLTMLKTADFNLDLPTELERLGKTFGLISNRPDLDRNINVLRKRP